MGDVMDKSKKVSIEERLENFFNNHPASKKALTPLKRSAKVVIHINPIGDFNLEKNTDGIQISKSEHQKGSDFEAWMDLDTLEELMNLNSHEPGDFGIAFFKGMLERKIKVKVHAGFFELYRKGYFGVLMTGGKRVLGWLAQKGIRGPSGFKKAVNMLRKKD